MVTNDVFIYHLDNELQKLFSLSRYHDSHLYQVFKLATRIGFLICNEKILIPASNYFESDIAFKILNELKELNEIGAISLISSSHNIDELLEKKVSQHGKNITLPNYHYNDFIEEEKRIILPGTLKKRERSASADIKTGWYSSIGNSGIENALGKLSMHSIKASKFEDLLYEVPYKLGSKAYISEYILPLLPIESGNEKKADTLLNVFITREYISSFMNEFNAVCLKDIPFIDSDIILPPVKDEYNPYISYQEIATKLKILNYKGVNALSFIENCNAHELIEFKYSPTWQSVIERVTYGDPENEMFTEIKPMDKYCEVKIGIITALPKECAAMKMMLSDVEECFFDGKGAGHRFFVGKIRSADGKKHKIALAQCGMGNNKAAIRATNMLSHFTSIDSIIMTGIAGGIPSYVADDKQVRLGDIVVSSGITQYDYVKETDEFIECRSSQATPSARLLEAVDVLKTYEYEDIFPWRKFIDDFTVNPNFSKPSIDTDKLFSLNGELCEHPTDRSRTKYPKVFKGSIASANTLLKNPHKRDILKSKYGALAVEMEASGIADATWNNSTGYLVVRGVCDYCDTNKNDLWQEYAALVAAAYTRSIIEMLPSF